LQVNRRSGFNHEVDETTCPRQGTLRHVAARDAAVEPMMPLASDAALGTVDRSVRCCAGLAGVAGAESGLE
jgi:hypothetical protein